MTDDVKSAADLRPQVLAFALAMERQLRANDFKGGWEDCYPEELLRRLREETLELELEIKRAGDRAWRDWDPEAHASGPRPHQQLIVIHRPGRGWFCTDLHAPKVFHPTADDVFRITDEAADVANFAMMIADVAALAALKWEG